MGNDAPIPPRTVPPLPPEGVRVEWQSRGDLGILGPRGE